MVSMMVSKCYDRAANKCSTNDAWEFENKFALEIIKECGNVLGDIMAVDGLIIHFDLDQEDDD